MRAYNAYFRDLRRVTNQIKEPQKDQITKKIAVEKKGKLLPMVKK